MGTEDSLPDVKWPDNEADHSTPSGAEIKDDWNYTSTPPYAFLACTMEEFTFTFY